MHNTFVSGADCRFVEVTSQMSEPVISLSLVACFQLWVTSRACVYIWYNEHHLSVANSGLRMADTRGLVPDYTRQFGNLKTFILEK